MPGTLRSSSPVTVVSERESQPLAPGLLGPSFPSSVGQPCLQICRHPLFPRALRTQAQPGPHLPCLHSGHWDRGQRRTGTEGLPSFQAESARPQASGRWADVEAGWPAREPWTKGCLAHRPSARGHDGSGRVGPESLEGNQWGGVRRGFLSCPFPAKPGSLRRPLLCPQRCWLS